MPIWRAAGDSNSRPLASELSKTRLYRISQRFCRVTSGGILFFTVSMLAVILFQGLSLQASMPEVTREVTRTRV